MGPIDFSKFDNVVDQYALSFDFAQKASEIELLKTQFRKFVKYLKLIDTEVKLSKVVKANPKVLRELQEKFDKAQKFKKLICTSKKENEDCNTCKNCITNSELINFHTKLMEILNYEHHGKPALRYVYSQIGMKACYVCNAQYALTAEPENPIKNVSTLQNRYSAKFQFDHFLPKVDYPCFSISLYNLLPICSSCNSIKNKYDIGIDFMDSSEANWKGKFKFKLIEKSLSDFLLKNKQLELDFEDTYDYPVGIGKLADRFDIKGVYNTQIDIIEELIMRKLKYSDAYKHTLSTSFPSIFKNITIDERIILGSYKKKDGIHKRPFSKFLQDIEEQLDDYFQNEIKSK
jgi:hypothetical protein